MRDEKGEREGLRPTSGNETGAEGEQSLSSSLIPRTSSLTIGSVPYLNAAPLVRWFTDTQEGRASGVRVIEAVPSELARMLERGEVAAAMVSSFELLRRPHLCYASGIAVAADGPVLSVRMLSKLPVERIRTVALDTSSLTSVALLKILLAELYDLTPQYLPHPPDIDAMLAEADAALLIGDIGYREYDASLHVLDLGEGWKRLTGLPFAYALWIGPRETLTPGLTRVLRQAAAWGNEHREEIARVEYALRGESLERTRHYLTQIMKYEVGPAEEESLRQFAEKSFRHGLIGALPRIESCAADAGDEAEA